MNLKRRLLLSMYKALSEAGYFYWMNKHVQIANILMYHRVNDIDTEFLSVKTKVFDTTMRMLRDHFNVISLQSLIEKLKNNQEIEHKTVIITFDDGYKDNYLYAAPILMKHELPATFFLTSGYINSEKIFEWDRMKKVIHPTMAWDDVRELSNAGFDIGAHTVNHVDLGKVSLQEAREEIFQSKYQIEKEIAKNVRLFAYPFGRKNCIRPEVINIIKQAGYECCCSGHGGIVTSSSDSYNLNRMVAYPSAIEVQMALDGFATHYEGKLSINIFGHRVNRY